MPKQTDIFIAFAKEDEELLNELRTHLKVLERTQNVKIWYDGLVEAGQEWQEVTKKAMSEAEIILLLISADFIASDECYDESMKQALNMHNKGLCRVVPVILRPCLWQETPFAKLQVLPHNQIPVTNGNWKNTEEPYLQITEHLNKLVHDFQDKNEINKSPDIINPSYGNEPEVSTTTSRMPRLWYFIGGALLTVTAAILYYFYFENKENKKALEIEKQERIADSTATVINYLKHVEIGTQRLIGSPSPNDYLAAYREFELALDEIKGKPYKIPIGQNVLQLIEKCKQNLSINRQDSTYVKAFMKYDEKVDLGNKLFLEATQLRKDNKKEEAAAKFKTAIVAYDAAITAVGTTKIDIRAAREGKIACEKAILEIYEPIAIVTIPTTRPNKNTNTSTSRRTTTKNPKSKTPTIAHQVVDMKHWERSMEQSAKKIEITEKYKEVAPLKTGNK